jgi:hypothetical protein
MSVILESGGTKSSLVSGLHALGSWAEALARGDKLSARIPALGSAALATLASITAARRVTGRRCDKFQAAVPPGRSVEDPLLA